MFGAFFEETRKSVSIEKNWLSVMIIKATHPMKAEKHPHTET